MFKVQNIVTAFRGHSLNSKVESPTTSSKLISSEELFASFKKFSGEIMKSRDSYVLKQAMELRRNGRYTEAAKLFEQGGEIYSAMYSLHRAIDVGEGKKSENFTKLSQLYHKVGRHERGKRYFGYAQYELYHENLGIVKKYCVDCGEKVEIKKVARDMGEAMYDDPRTFEANLKDYFSQQMPMVAQS